MSDIKILILEPESYSNQAIETYRSIGSVDFGPLTRRELLNNIKEYEILVIRLAHQIDEIVLTKATKLKVIVSPTTGTDHIDQDGAQKADITVLSLKGEDLFLKTIPATAELTWGLLLALIRNIPAASYSVVEGKWDRDAYRGHDLAGKNLGILGLGRIGEKTAKYGLAFGMKVFAFDPKKSAWVNGVEKINSIEGLFQKSQILLVHVPFDQTTINLIDGRLLAQLPDDAILVNTSRGQVINEEDLLNALRTGKLAGAALDVIRSENSGIPTQSDIVKYAKTHSNLLITPHIGGATIESMKMTEEFMARKMVDFLKQKMEL